MARKVLLALAALVALAAVAAAALPAWRIADHTHGNPRYPPGPPVYAAAPAAQLLQRFDADFWAEEPARSLAPNRIFEGETEIDFAFVNGFYPNVDLRSGGSIPGMLAAIERVLALDFDVAVPGHGFIGTRADVEKARDYLVALWSYAREAARTRRTVEEALRDAPQTLRGLREIPFLTSLEKNLTWAMQKAAPK